MKVVSTVLYGATALALLQGVAACTTDTTPVSPSVTATASEGTVLAVPTKSASGSSIQSGAASASELDATASAFSVSPKRPSINASFSQFQSVVGKLRAMHIRGMPSFALSLAAMEAMEMKDPEARHAAIQALPVTITRGDGGTDSYGRALVSLRVNVNGKAVINRLVPGAAATQGGDGGGELESQFVGGPHVEEANPAMFDCDGDPCATQQDRDDALATLAVLQTELDSAQTATNTVFGNCLADEVCAGWYDQDANALGPLASDNGVGPAGGPRLLMVSAPECQPADATSVDGAYFGCGWQILAAAGGVAWAVGEVAAM